LIFSKDDVDKAAALINDVYAIADQLVLVDSSSAGNLRRLKAIKKEKGLKKLEIFHAVAFGYADPLRMFGLHKCKHDWVLYLDTDERISEALKSDVKRIISDARAHAYAIKRYEEAHLSGERSQFFTWQIRLYDRNFVRFMGIPHEQPIVDGAVERLDTRYHILHIVELKVWANYWTLEMDERFSYETFNERILDYAFKIMMPARRDFRKTALGKLMYGALRACEALTLKKADEEISSFDYFALYLLRDLVYQIKMRNLAGMLRALPNRIRYMKMIKERQSTQNGRVMFEIYRKIEKIGIIKYLGLDDDKMVRMLNEKYAGKKQGIDLLVKLLEDKYYGRYP
jgi:glycosyltransferase involved in cell wall biosynthesis